MLSGFTIDREVSVDALLDSGADVSLCHRDWADKYFDMGLIMDSDICRGSDINIQFADGDEIQPLGKVRVRLGGVSAELLVVDQLSPQLIVGRDLLRQSDDFMDKLVSMETGMSLGSG